jgi:glutaredoxin
MRTMLLLAALVIAGAGCRKPTPAVPPPQELAPLEVNKDGSWLYTYVDEKGEFTTVDKPDAVPASARRLVRVIDPSKGDRERHDTTSVYVVDVNQLLHDGKATARPLSRAAFETAAIAQLPPGASSLLSERPSAYDGGAEPATGSSTGAPVVTVYGASWCGACREAKHYLAQRKIPFIEKDVERDPAAARELHDKAARFGIPTDRIPILDVRGRLLVGFDPARLDALLGEPT